MGLPFFGLLRTRQVEKFGCLQPLEKMLKLQPMIMRRMPPAYLQLSVWKRTFSLQRLFFLPLLEFPYEEDINFEIKYIRYELPFHFRISVGRTS